MFACWVVGIWMATEGMAMTSVAGVYWNTRRGKSNEGTPRRAA